MVRELSPELAALPLDSGGSVTDLTRRSIARELRRALDFGVKGAKKVDQRLRRRPKPPAADGGLVRRLQQGWSVEHTETLEDVGVFRPQVLAALASAEPVDQMTLSLAINVVAAQRFLGTVRANVSVPTESPSPPIS